MKNLLTRTFHGLASYHLATSLLVLLMLTTFFGTIEQKHLGIYLAQKKYFDVWPAIVFPELFIGKLLPIPIVSAFWLGILLFANLLCGGIIRIRKKPETWAILVTHSGILLLLVSGFIEHFQRKEGGMLVYEGESADFAQSYHEDSIEICTIVEGKRSAPWVVPYKELKHLGRKEQLHINIPSLPFDLIVEGFVKNSALIQDPHGIGGWKIQEIAHSKEQEMNRPACYLSVVDKNGKRIQRLLLQGSGTSPLVATFPYEGTVYGASLVREIWPLPFRIDLNRSVGTYYPGTRKASWFQSDVTRVDGKDQRDYSIVMNKPMRYKGYTLYQSRWEDTGEHIYSGFSVVQNPADQLPKYALYIAGIGLLLHFGMKLMHFVLRQTRKDKAL